MNHLKTLLGLTLMASAMASCSVEEQETSAEEKYAEEFYKEFGLADKNHDWNVVEQKSLTFDVKKPAHVKIYELQGDEYRLAADYDNVTNGQTVTFDGMEGDDESFIVSVDDVVLTAKNGETVSLNGSTSNMLKTSKSDGSTFVTQTDYKEIALLTSGQDQVMNNLTKEGENHRNNVQKSNLLMQKSKSPYHTYYPVYWNSAYTHEVGVFYYDKSSTPTKHEIAIYEDHGGDELQYYFNPTSDNTDGTAGYKSVSGNQCTKLDGYTVDDTKNVKAKGYQVKLDDGIMYGIYVKIGDKTYYSNASLNDDGQSHFAYHSYRNSDGTSLSTYIMFDDPETNDGDYNDLVLYVPEELSPISDDATGWTVACEDLGGTYDFDFNDLVFRVYHTSGYEYLTIVPLAAGGTLPAYLQYANVDGFCAFNTEWHKYFGNGYDSGTMINTSSLTETKNNKLIVIEDVAKSFSMATFAKLRSDAGDFSIEIIQKDGSTGARRSTVIYGADPSNATAKPQILVLPLNWKWPKELVHIKNVYTGNGSTPSFMDWVADKNKTKWTQYYEKDKVLYYEDGNFDMENAEVHRVGESPQGTPIHGADGTVVKYDKWM